MIRAATVIWGALVSVAVVPGLIGCTVNRGPGLPGPNSDAGDRPADGPAPVVSADAGAGDGPGGAPDAPVATGCDGAGCGSRPLAAACTMSAECQSGACMDGVCCEGPCTGACVTCNQPGSIGRCVPVEEGGPDPRRICPDEGEATCGRSGRCNGLGGCARYPAGSRCQPPTCVSTGSMTPGAVCDGQGRCNPGPAIVCEPYQCTGNACRDGCESDADCVPPATCAAGSCGKRGLGQACQGADDCKSGFCADGVCCTEACSGRCRSCALVSALGRCVDVPADTPDPRRARGVTDPAAICAEMPVASCGTNGLCNGVGGCQMHPAGRSCAPASCDAATNRFTGVSTCDGMGRCQAPAGVSCAPFRCGGAAACASSCTGDGECVAPAVCRQGSCGQRPPGQACASAAECQSGHCAQGVCCDSACTGSCVSCAVPGSVGRCTPVPAGMNDPSGTCGPTCTTDATSVQNRRCDGNRGCALDPTPTPCGAYQCRGGACLTSCRADEDCSGGNVCTGGTCGARMRKAAGASCMAGAECLTGNCVNGTCCVQASCGTCQSCANPTGACLPATPGATCGTATCTADNRSAVISRCDTSGACRPAAPESCGSFVCRAGVCQTRCDGDEDCTMGRCRGFMCK